MNEQSGSGAPAQGEETLLKQHPSLVTRSGSLLLAALLVAAAVAVWLLPPARPGQRGLPWLIPVGSLVLGAILVLRAWILTRSATFFVTSVRVRQVEGLLGRSTWETAVRDVRNITVRQGVSDRMLGIGTVEITSAAGPGVDVTFHGVRNPHAVSELIWKLKR